jgi:ribonuclease HI
MTSGDGRGVSCATCGATFTPPEDLLTRFPGWQPRECQACYRAARRGGRTASAASAAGGVAAATRGGGGPRRPAQREQLLTLAQVLDRYDAGPDTGVFTDGSANPNPGPGGWGAVYVVAGEVIAQAHGHDPQTTNNRMELQALIAGIELVPEGTPAVVHSDSNLVVRTVTEWAAGWEARGWRRKTGPVENLDLVRQAYERLRGRPELEVRWIKAHPGNRWNEYADSLATAYARDEL